MQGANRLLVEAIIQLQRNIVTAFCYFYKIEDDDREQQCSSERGGENVTVDRM
jgi:hypothetical protein